MQERRLFSTKKPGELLSLFNSFGRRHRVHRRKGGGYWLRKTSGNKWARTTLGYLFLIRLEENEKETAVFYRACPDPATAFQLLLFPSILVYVLARWWITGEISWLFFGSVGAFTVLMLVFYLLIKREYVQEFERMLLGSTPEG